MTWLGDIQAWLAEVRFAWPWLFLLLPLPLLVRWLLPPAPGADSAALRVPSTALFPRAEGTERGFALRPRLLVAALAWMLLVVAAARPQVTGDALEAPVTGRNLMLAVDLSGSMEARDFTLGGRTVNRLSATKAVAGEFIDRREGDRLGLILFGERAYLQAPLTFDRETVKTLLFEAVIGLAGEKTAIGDAITLAVKRVHDESEGGVAEGEQVLVLLTDGANTAGAISPLKAAELAGQVGLKIYTIGIGAETMEIPSLLGNRMRQVNPSLDLDEQTLTRIADTTGGRYFRATDTASLQEIYRILDELEPAATDEGGMRPVVDIFYWPLGGAFALMLGGLALRALAGAVAASRPALPSPQEGLPRAG
ncbi:MAG TPA: VWA domain-containing protein [Woeseiaceae bacterium]|nr:VWA domain-containing protein [Woeseiaceae bacterium]